MRWIQLAMLSLGLGATVQAHHPDREHQPVRPRIDVIGPLGNNLPMGYRRRYNRPSNWEGKILYHIAPSSQEAMAWHNATHRGDYANHRPRVEMHYFYPKPWEALRTGPRPRPADLPAEEQVELVPEGLEGRGLFPQDEGDPTLRNDLQLPDQNLTPPVMPTSPIEPDSDLQRREPPSASDADADAIGSGLDQPLSLDSDLLED